MSDVPIPQRTAALELVTANPGRRAAELTALCPSVILRAWLPTALMVLRECCTVRIDDRGRYWPT
ncbi:hypothetical protein [Streptomyces sp. Root1310]|uniref:hypothetical protein n=1 Tax=Streptomyces sp. Root1310 TaxID=1736452 RepID=UPI00070F252B|nr:hypothetical protein [Streptomyces sp. Root1310]KQX63426.1 hypothetical protein ASD48_26060 [Streptomyces sp. Root1310]